MKRMIKYIEATLLMLLVIAFIFPFVILAYIAIICVELSFIAVEIITGEAQEYGHATKMVVNLYLMLRRICNEIINYETK